MKQLLTLVAFLSMFLCGCQKEDTSSSTLPDEQVDYKFSFSLDDSYVFTQQEKKIEEVALFLYNDKGEFVSSAYSKTSEISLSLSGKQKIAKALAVANFSVNTDWGIFIMKDDKPERIDLKEDILSGRNQLDHWEKCTQLAFGNDKSEPTLLPSPIPMAGSAELTSEEAHTIILTPAVAKVTIKNTSTHFPDIKEVLINNVKSFNPIISSDKNPAYSETCSIHDTQPEINEEKEIDYYIPYGKKNTLLATLGNSSETMETLSYQIDTEDKKEPIILPISEKQEPLPFTVELKYNGAVMSNELQVPAKASSGTLEMKTSTGKAENDGTLSLRAANGTAWAKISHEYTTYQPDAIWHLRDGSLLEFEENLGEERQMVAEFYSKTSGIVYHRMTFKQAASSDYLNISSPSLAVDRYGNIYDEPFSLKVESNKEWEIRSAASWVKFDYTPHNRSQTVEIAVEENTSQQARSTELEFVINGNVVKQFPITQSATENSTFNLKYELNLEMTTVDNGFKGQLSTTQAIYYANDVQIYNPGTSANMDETIKMRSDEQYGFITDAPASYNKIVVNDIASPLLIYPNYRGTAATQNNSNGITIANKEYAQSFFRQIRYTLPIPAGVKRTQKMVYNIKIENITGNAMHHTPEISYSIINQK